MKESNYKKLGLMLLISFCIMYAVMFLNVDNSGHIYLSLTRMYMSLLMVSPMALLMLILMKKMFQNRRINQVVVTSAIMVFTASLCLLRTQTPVSDVQYMKAMIPHHSSAIMTSKNADIKDPEVKKLAEGIIESQEKEITQMKKILRRISD